jgi:AcrR family transcriptional regulator
MSLFFRQPVRNDPFEGITYKAVAAAAGISRQGMQKYWTTRQEFTADLAAFLLGNEDLYAESFQQIQEVIGRTRDEPLFDALAQIATADLESITDSPVFAAMTILAVVHVRGNDQLTVMARRGYNALDDSTWADIYGGAILRAGRVPREPMTGRAIGVLLQALVEGSGVRHLFDSGMLSEGDREVRSRYGLYALAVAALLAVMTRPRDGQDGRAIEQVIADLLRND